MATDHARSRIITAIAEAKELLGTRLAAVCVAGPTLESSLSTVALAQSELGQSRVLSRLSRRISGSSGAESAFLTSDADGDGMIPPFRNWLDVVATLSTVDIALGVWLRAIAAGLDDQTARQSIDRILEEEKFHTDFSGGWVRVLTDDPATQAPFAETADRTNQTFRAWQEKLRADAETVHAAGGLTEDHSTIAAAAEDAVAAALPWLRQALSAHQF